MGIERLKRWHWVVLSIPLGLLCAWIMLETGPQGMQTAYATMGADAFEAHVLGKARFGRESAKPEDVRVYPPDHGMYLVTAMLPDGEPKQNANRQWELRLRAKQINAKTPYIPLTALREPPHMQLKFDNIDRTAQFRSRDVKPIGWLDAGRGYRDPGQEGALLEFPLSNTADCRLTLRINPGTTTPSGDLKVWLNDHALSPLTPDPSDPTSLRTTVPAAFLKQGMQTLKIARGLTPVSIAGIDVVNPNYTVVDFLNAVKKQDPSFEFTYRASWEPRQAYLWWTLGSLVIVGGVWPTVIQLMIGAGLAKAPSNEPTFDLSRFSGKSKKKQAKPAVAPVDDAETRRLADDLERRMLAEAKERGVSEAPAEEPVAPVKLLVTATLETPQEEKPTESKEYAGEYYPVVRKVEKH